MVLSRRQFLSGVGAAALVVGFDPVARSWVTAAHAASCASFDDAPPLDGTLRMDGRSLGAASRDKGNIVEQRPCAVLRPASVEDVRRMILFCRDRGIHVATRGQAHTTHGQGLVAAGLVIESRGLHRIHSIGPDGADVDAGVLWSELVEQAFSHGLRPPALTGYVQLSIGGTLSVGGISGSGGNRSGLQVDHVRELEVVTGAGDVVRCSPTSEPDLFEVMLGGLGQCGVITRAVVELLPAKAMVRTYSLYYAEDATFFRDFRTLNERGELDGVMNLWLPNGTALIHQLNAIAFHDPSDPPDDAHLLRDLEGLRAPPIPDVVSDMPYPRWATRVDRLVDLMRSAAAWDRTVKPWFDVWLPEAAVEGYVSEAVRGLKLDDVGPGGFVLLFPQRRSHLTRPFVPMPDAPGDEWVYLFDILTCSLLPGPDPGFAQRKLARNRALFDRARALGGTRYAIGSVDFDQADWVEHYGDAWPELVRRKALYDPDGIMTPGPGIF